MSPESSRACSDDSRKPGRSCLVSTLGMFIIDTFRFENASTGQDEGDHGLGEQIGGGGTYFALGARMWLFPEQVLMTVDRGEDFASETQSALNVYANGYGSSGPSKERHALWRFRERKGECTTRAVNVYRAEYRDFAYLTPKLRLDPMDLLDDQHTRLPEFIHCICSPDRASEICGQVQSLRSAWPLVKGKSKRPRIVWEPIPDSAVKANLAAAIKVAGQVDVMSPNHEEAASLLGKALSKEEQGDDTARKEVESIYGLLFDHIKRQNGDENMPVICIRSGALGALVGTANGAQKIWIPAYHENGEGQAKIVDVTGAGNAWLGGFTAGLALAEGDEWMIADVKKAAEMGSVSASFTIEQLGLPTLAFTEARENAKELWNGELPSDRLLRLQRRNDRRERRIDTVH